MGTNYLWHTPACAACGRADTPIHIGKSSAGWCFQLHIYPESGINELADWETLWAKKESWIEDQYGRRLTPEEMRAVICERKGASRREQHGEVWWRAFHSENLSADGPNGLLRSVAGLTRPGKGTYDLAQGEFS